MQHGSGGELDKLWTGGASRAYRHQHFCHLPPPDRRLSITAQMTDEAKEERDRGRLKKRSFMMRFD